MNTESKIIWYDAAELPGLGWVQFTEIGEENMYFVLKNGIRGFCKIEDMEVRDIPSRNSSNSGNVK